MLLAKKKKMSILGAPSADTRMFAFQFECELCLHWATSSLSQGHALSCFHNCTNKVAGTGETLCEMCEEFEN